VVPATLAGTSSTDCAVAHHTIKPGDEAIGGLLLSDQLEQRFLDDILGRCAPLARIQHQCRCVLIDQPPEEFWTHHENDASRTVLSQNFIPKAAGVGRVF
jgi:hypothetical protein